MGDVAPDVKSLRRNWLSTIFNTTYGIVFYISI